MDTGAVRFYSTDFRFLKEVDEAVVIWTGRWHTYGAFEIHLDKMEPFVRKNNRVIFDGDEYKSGIIKYIFVDTDESVTVKGFTLLYLLKDRITVPSSGQDYVYYNDNIENIMVNLVKMNAVTPSDEKRKIPGLRVVESQGRGEKLAYQSSYTEVTECLEELSKYSMLGVAVRMDISSKSYVFEVLEGKDRSVNQQLRAPVVFRKDYDNLMNTTYTMNDSETKNCAYTAGRGEGAERALCIVNDDLTGEERREVFIDANDVEDAGELLERGETKLAGMKPEENFEAETVATDYQNRWYMGDMVTVIDEDTGITLNDYVIEIQETLDQNGYEVVPTFGVPESGLSSGGGSGGGTGGSGGGSDSRYTHTQITPMAVWEIEHNMGKFPSVTVTDSAGSMVTGEVEYIDRNTVQLSFSGAFSGFAYLN